MQYPDVNTWIGHYDWSKSSASIMKPWFFRLLLSNCLNWKINCDDQSSLSSTTAVQIWVISYIFFTLYIRMNIRMITCKFALQFGCMVNLWKKSPRTNKLAFAIPLKIKFPPNDAVLPIEETDLTSHLSYPSVILDHHSRYDQSWDWLTTYELASGSGVSRLEKLVISYLLQRLG